MAPPDIQLLFSQDGSIYLWTLGFCMLQLDDVSDCKCVSVYGISLEAHVAGREQTKGNKQGFSLDLSSVYCREKEVAIATIVELL